MEQRVEVGSSPLRPSESRYFRSFKRSEFTFRTTHKSNTLLAEKGIQMRNIQNPSSRAVGGDDPDAIMNRRRSHLGMPVI